jgi:hypothetical protein
MKASGEVVYFPALKAGLTRTTAAQLRRFIIATWHLMLSGRTFIEDAEGAVGSPEYLLMLKIRLAETIAAVDFLLRGSELPDEAHRLAIAAELGLVEVASLSPDQLWEKLSFDVNQGSREEFERLSAFWNAILEGFPATLPNPLVAGGGTRDLINTLRSWSHVLDQCEIDGQFLIELYKSI